MRARRRPRWPKGAPLAGESVLAVFAITVGLVSRLLHWSLHLKVSPYFVMWVAPKLSALLLTPGGQLGAR